MKRFLKSILLLFFFCNIINAALCQGERQSKKLGYKPPTNVNGLTPVSVELTYQVQNLFGSINVIFDAKCTGDLAYQYKGREFTFSGADAEVRAVVVKDPVINVLVTGPNGFKKEMKLWVSSGLGGGFFGNSALIKEALTKEEKDPKNYIITPLQVMSVSYENVWAIQKILDEKLRNEKNAAEVVSFIEEGDKAMFRQNYVEAEDYFLKARKLDKGNQYAAIQLEKIKKEKDKGEIKKKFDDLMSAAKSAEAQGDFDNAERLYGEAGTAGQNNNYAQNEANRISALKTKKKKDIEDQINQMNEKADKEQKALKDANDKSDVVTKKAMEEKSDYLKKLLKEKSDSIADELDKSEKAKFDEKQKTYWKEVEAEEKRKEILEEEKEKVAVAARQREDAKELQKAEAGMAYDAEKYFESVQDAGALMNKALSISPWQELQLKKEWWDNNPYIQLFADDLYEKQRRENHWNYLKKQSEAKGAFYAAKEGYLYAVRFTDRNSDHHEFLLRKIEACNKEIAFYEKSWKEDFKDEGNRIKFREQSRVMAEAQTRGNNLDKANLAYEALSYSPNSSAEAVIKKYELYGRMNMAEQKYKQDMAVAGVTQSVAINAILNDDKAVAVVKNGSMLNAFTSFGYGYIPMLMNETSDVNTPKTTIDKLVVVTTNVGLDAWLYRSKNIDVNLGGFAGIGVMPMKGVSGFYLHYGAKANIDFGFKRFKLANTVQWLTRTGTQEVDYDVFRAGNTNSTVQGYNAMGKGKFNYTVLRIGSGFKIDLGDAYDASHILFTVFAEKPGFYTENIFKNPIFSYQFEWMSKSNLVMNIAYAKNYAIAGEKKYYIPEQKNGDYFQFQFGKYWTILK